MHLGFALSGISGLVCMTVTPCLASVDRLHEPHMPLVHLPKQYHFQDLAVEKQGSLDEFQVVHGILTPSEARYYSKIAKSAISADRKMIGRYQAPAPLLGNITQRIQALSDDPGVCTSDDVAGNCGSTNIDSEDMLEGPEMVKITRINRSIPGHTDILAEDLSPMVDHVFFILLNTNPNAWFRWGDHRVPVIDNTAMVFRGNTTHQVIVEEGEVEFLGPVGLNSFEEIGYGCTGETINVKCSREGGTTEQIIVEDIDNNPCNQFQVTITCDPAFGENKVCFDCVNDQFSFYTDASSSGITGFVSNDDGTTCNFEESMSTAPSQSETCTDTQGSSVTMSIVNLDRVSSEPSPGPSVSSSAMPSPLSLENCSNADVFGCDDNKQNKVAVCVEKSAKSSKKQGEKKSSSDKSSSKSEKTSKKDASNVFDEDTVELKSKCVDPTKDLKDSETIVSCGCCEGDSDPFCPVLVV